MVKCQKNSFEPRKPDSNVSVHYDISTYIRNRNNDKLQCFIQHILCMDFPINLTIILDGRIIFPLQRCRNKARKKLNTMSNTTQSESTEVFRRANLSPHKRFCSIGRFVLFSKQFCQPKQQSDSFFGHFFCEILNYQEWVVNNSHFPIYS